jgi:hypothetical protein
MTFKNIAVFARVTPTRDEPAHVVAVVALAKG